jgi:indole-3-glycerol phosphate synthase
MSILDSLYEAALADAAAREAVEPIGHVREQAAAQPPARDVLAALAPRDTVHVIAEVKRASPSRGALAEIPDPAALAAVYAEHGASVVSVLTERTRFHGSLDDLRAVRARVDIPVLRKDFIATEYQIVEARAAGADLVLLIVAGLDDDRLRTLRELAESLGMQALVETHTASEVERAVASGARIIGVNARDLTTFDEHPERFGELARAIPEGAVRVAESAVRAPGHVADYRRAGADAVLIGQALVTGDPAETLDAFLRAGTDAVVARCGRTPRVRPHRATTGERRS